MIAFANKQPFLIGLKGDLTFRLFGERAINAISSNEITLSSSMEAIEYWEAFNGQLKPIFLEGIGYVPRGWCLSIRCRPYLAWREGDALWFKCLPTAFKERGCKPYNRPFGCFIEMLVELSRLKMGNPYERLRKILHCYEVARKEVEEADLVLARALSLLKPSV